jgi:hypothetical protein
MELKICPHRLDTKRLSDDLCGRRTAQLPEARRQDILFMQECLDCRQFQLFRRVARRRVVELNSTFDAAAMGEAPSSLDVQERYGESIPFSIG